MKRRNVKYGIGILVILIMGLISFLLLFFYKRDKEILKVGKVCINEEEFQFFLSREKSEAYVYFTQNYGAISDQKTFWTNDFAGTTPLERAKERALNSCIYSKSLQIYALKCEIIDDISFESIQKSWKQFNSRRKKSIEDGSIVYGPVTLSFDEYFNYFESNLKNKMQEYMQKKEPFTEKEIEAYYNQNPSLFSLENTQVTQILYISNEIGIENAQALMGEAKTKVARGFDFKQIAKEDENISYSLREFSAETSKEDLRNSSQMLSVISGMKVGEFSDVMSDNKGIYIIKLMKREEGCLMPLEEVKNRIRDLLWEKKCKEDIEQIKETSKVAVNRKNFDSITIE